MEESKPQTRRSSTGRPSRPGGSSSHVIDLRGTAPAASSAPVAPPKPKTKPSSAKPARKPLAAPNQSKVKPPEPAAAADAPAPATPSAAALGPEPALAPRRFWPAFWRFLVLLIILAVLVSGGLYLYINYLRG